MLQIVFATGKQRYLVNPTPDAQEVFKPQSGAGVYPWVERTSQGMSETHGRDVG